jgi:hypothetical protein
MVLSLKSPVMAKMVTARHGRSQKNLDTDLKTKKLKCKTQNQNLKLKTNDSY